MSKQLSILILICCLALIAAGCAPAPDPAAEEPAPVMEEAAEEVIPTDTPLPPTEELEAEESEETEEPQIEEPAPLDPEAIPEGRTISEPAVLEEAADE